MIRIRFDKGDVQALLKGVTKYVETEVVNDISTEMKKQIETMKLTSEGFLMDSVKPEVDQKTVFVNAPYAGYVEYGTPGVLTAPKGMPVGRRGAPPMDNLERWAKLKLASKNGPSDSKRRKNEEHKMAKAVCRWINLHGTKPHPYCRNTIDIIEMRYRRAKVRISVKRVV